MDKLVIAVLLIAAVAVVLFGGAFFLQNLHGGATAYITFNPQTVPPPASGQQHNALVAPRDTNTAIAIALGQIAEATKEDARAKRIQAQVFDQLVQQLQNRSAVPPLASAHPPCSTDCDWSSPAPPR